MHRPSLSCLSLCFGLINPLGYYFPSCCSSLSTHTHTHQCFGLVVDRALEEQQQNRSVSLLNIDLVDCLSEGKGSHRRLDSLNNQTNISKKRRRRRGAGEKRTWGSVHALWRFLPPLLSHLCGRQRLHLLLPTGLWSEITNPQQRNRQEGRGEGRKEGGRQERGRSGRRSRLQASSPGVGHIP